MNNTPIQIGDYLIYPALILLLIFIIVIVTLFFIGFMAVSKSSAKKSKRNIYTITSWQRNNLEDSLDYANDCRELDSDVDQTYSDYEEFIPEFIQYIKSHKYWNIDELKAINSSLPIKISYLLMQDVIASCFNEELEDVDRAILLLHTIDMINGGAEMDGKKYLWMDNEIEETMGTGMTPEESRMKTIFFWALDGIAEYFDEDGNITDDSAPSYIEKYTENDYEKAYGNLASKIKITDIDADTKEMIAAGLIDSLSDYMLCNQGEIDRITLCSIRSLACLLDGNDYSEILNSLKK